MRATADERSACGCRKRGHNENKLQHLCYPHVLPSGWGAAGRGRSCQRSSCLTIQHSARTGFNSTATTHCLQNFSNNVFRRSLRPTSMASKTRSHRRISCSQLISVVTSWDTTPISARQCRRGRCRDTSTDQPRTILSITNRQWVVEGDVAWINYTGYLKCNLNVPGFYVGEKITVQNGLIHEILIAGVVLPSGVCPTS